VRHVPVLPAAAARRLAATMLLLVLGLPAGPALAGPLRAYVLAGQSNMQGHAHARTIDAMRLDADTAALLALMRDEDGAARASGRTWISVAGEGDGDPPRPGPLPSSVPPSAIPAASRRQRLASCTSSSRVSESPST